MKYMLFKQLWHLHSHLVICFMDNLSLLSLSFSPLSFILCSPPSPISWLLLHDISPYISPFSLVLACFIFTHRPLLFSLRFQWPLRQFTVTHKRITQTEKLWDVIKVRIKFLCNSNGVRFIKWEERKITTRAS